MIHVDPLGGWSGDMFVAACLDAFPELWPVVSAAIESLDLGAAATCELRAHRDHALTGKRFVVAGEVQSTADPTANLIHYHDPGGSEHAHSHALDTTSDGRSNPDHGHRHWSDIRGQLRSSALDPAVVDHAIKIFSLLAEAEAEVHGVEPDHVAFHEVGAVDSIVDIVAAGVLIDRIGAGGWSAGPLPTGSGRVRTAHGILPVPAPATALLLRGLEVIDDGIPGERVTPTGAAIARYLLANERSRSRQARRLTAIGTGFGSRSLPGISNCLRILVSQPATEQTSSFSHRELGVIEFEIDDQSPEDLSHGLDHIRQCDGVHDVIQSVAFGKKGRMAAHIQVLVAPSCLDKAIAACFSETTTIGLRHHIVQGAALPRSFQDVEVDGHNLRVKTVTRPDGTVTGKTEAADVAAESGHAARTALRRAGESAALLRGTDAGAGEG